MLSSSSFLIPIEGSGELFAFGFLPLLFGESFLFGELILQLGQFKINSINIVNIKIMRKANIFLPCFWTSDFLFYFCEARLARRSSISSRPLPLCRRFHLRRIADTFLFTSSTVPTPATHFGHYFLELEQFITIMKNLRFLGQNSDSGILNFTILRLFRTTLKT